MTQLLHIDSSPRGARSHTRRLTRDFVELWCDRHPRTTIAYRDLGRSPPPVVDEAWIAAAFTEPVERSAGMRAALALSDALVEELIASDTLVLGVPMYNFGIPATLKAYIDQVVRIGRTFSFDPAEPQPYKPLTIGKRAFVVVASGDHGYQPGGNFAALNQVEPYLRTVLNFIGIAAVDFIYAGNDEFGGEQLLASLAEATDRVRELVAG